MNEYFTLKEVAARLRVHPETVRRWLLAGELKGYRLAGRGQWRITEGNLNEFIRISGADDSPAVTR